MGLISTPLVAETLGDESWYGDGQPTWEHALTSEKAERCRRCCVKRLRRLSKGQPDAGELAAVLDDCKPDSRCMSGACQECSRALQRWFVANVRTLLVPPYRSIGRELVAISVVFPDGVVGQGRLDTVDVTNIRRRFIDVLNAVGGTDWLVAGLDISLNDDTAKHLGIRWYLQLYGTARVQDREAFSEGLRTHYLPCRQIRRPVQTKASDGSQSAISYAFKTDFVRRVAYWGTAGLKGNRRKCWQTRKVSLRPREHVKLLLWLHKIGLARRHYLRGVRMTKTREGVSLVEIRKRE